MTKIEELYSKVKLPINEELFNELLQKYYSIPMEKTKYEDELYNQINKPQKAVINKEKIKMDVQKFDAEINENFIKAGRPFDPSKHGDLANPVGEQPGWLTYKSWNLLGGEKIHSNDQIHRLYISVASNDKIDFAKELYDEFKNNKIPFYFKVDFSDEDRPDKIVIYTSTELLEKTLVALDNIARRRPDLMKNCNHPSFITGKVTDKIGYASELRSNNNVNNKSYTQIICNAFIKAIEDIFHKYNNRESISDNDYNLYQYKLNQAKIQGININYNVRKRIGIQVLLFNNPYFKNQVLTSFRNNIQNMGLDPDNMCFSQDAKKEIENKINTMKKIDIFDSKVLNKIITLPNGKTLTIDEYLTINGVWSFVPLDSFVTLGINGRTISGKDFIAGVIKRAENFNTFEELFKTYQVTIKRKDNNLNNNQYQNITEKPQFDNYSFAEIKYLFDNYSIINDNGEFKVINRKNKIIYEDSNFTDKVKFAHSWVSATRNGRSLTSIKTDGIIASSDDSYAFSEDAQKIYETIMTLASTHMQRFGFLIDSNTLENEVSKYVNYKYAKSIVQGLYSQERFKDSFENWLKMANNINQEKWHR